MYHTQGRNNDISRLDIPSQNGLEHAREAAVQTMEMSRCLWPDKQSIPPADPGTDSVKVKEERTTVMTCSCPTHLQPQGNPMMTGDPEGVAVLRCRNQCRSCEHLSTINWASTPDQPHLIINSSNWWWINIGYLQHSHAATVSLLGFCSIWLYAVYFMQIMGWLAHPPDTQQPGFNTQKGQVYLL